MEKITFGALFILFIGIIVALSMLPEIASNANQMSDKQIIVNETLDISSTRIGSTYAINASKELRLANYQTNWKVDGCPITSFTLKNYTGDTIASVNYTLYAPYANLTVKNIVELNKTSFNTTYASYTFCADGYVGNSASGVMVRVLLIFTALGIVGFAVYYVVKELNY